MPVWSSNLGLHNHKTVPSDLLELSSYPSFKPHPHLKNVWTSIGSHSIIDLVIIPVYGWSSSPCLPQISGFVFLLSYYSVPHHTFRSHKITPQYSWYTHTLLLWHISSILWINDSRIWIIMEKYLSDSPCTFFVNPLSLSNCHFILSGPQWEVGCQNNYVTSR